MILKGSSIVMECLKEEGTEIIFGYPGGGIMPLYDALYDYRDSVKHILTAHEQGATHAADGYARSTGKVGVCFATSGPGATNTVTGIATAYMDSVPMVVITGQVPIPMIGKDSFQEVDILGVTLPVTKHNIFCRAVEDIPAAIHKAFQIARSGRPGPVLVDIPKNLFQASTDYKATGKLSVYHGAKADDKDIDFIADAINNAKSPVIIAGGGIIISESSELLNKLAKKANIPVATTMMCLGAFDRRDELSVGMVGMHGEKEANQAVANSDLILALGTRFSDRVVGDVKKFASKAKIIHVDIDKAEIDKNVTTDFHVIGDCRKVLEGLIPKVYNNDNREWIEKVNGWRKQVKTSTNLKPRTLFNTVAEVLGDDCIVCTDVGQHQMWTAQRWPFNRPRTFISSGGLGTMGFGLGAAIGAKLGNEDKTVVLFSGDGSFRMNLNELATVSANNLKIIVIVIKNNTLGMVRQWQKIFFDKRYSQTDLEDVIDYESLAKGFGLYGCYVKKLEDFREEIIKAKNSDKASVIACEISVDANVLPMVPPGGAIADQLISIETK